MTDTNELCEASTDGTFLFMAECGRRDGHEGPHYDVQHDVTWPTDSDE